MGTIIDILKIMPTEIEIIYGKYPNCLILNTDLDTYDSTQNIVIVIPEGEENDYYDFLLEHCIAMSSKEFTYRISHEKFFAERMMARATKLVEEIRNNNPL
jgi:hypothetical protein